jgi:hypothetical protein
MSRLKKPFTLKKQQIVFFFTSKDTFFGSKVQIQFVKEKGFKLLTWKAFVCLFI